MSIIAREFMIHTLIVEDAQMPMGIVKLQDLVSVKILNYTIVIVSKNDATLIPTCHSASKPKISEFLALDLICFHGWASILKTKYNKEI